MIHRRRPHQGTLRRLTEALRSARQQNVTLRAEAEMWRQRAEQAGWRAA